MRDTSKTAVMRIGTVVTSANEARCTKQTLDPETQMNLINEFALLFAVSLPGLVIAGVQTALLFAGERGTGLLPGIARYPSVRFGGVRTTSVTPETGSAMYAEASNDEMERQAA